MSSRLRSCALTLALVAYASPASAMSRLFVDQGAHAARLAQVREAHAEGPTRTTTWMSAQVEGTPAEVAWVLSIPEGAALDVGATSWLDALESATAPRMLPPSSAPPDRACSVPPAPETVTDGDALPVMTSFVSLPATSVDLAVASLAARHIVVDAASKAELVEAASKGERLVVLVLTPKGTASWTLTLRVSSQTPMGLSGTDAAPSILDDAERVLWLLGPSRASLPARDEMTVEAPQIHWLTTVATDYAQSRADLLSSASAVGEVASSHALTSLTILPGNHVVPSAVDAYVERIGVRGEATSAAATTVNGFHDALAGANELGEPCPRGDIVAAGFVCTPPAPGSPERLLLGSGVADDLAFALAGTGARTWVTRLVTASRTIDAPAYDGGTPRSMAKQTSDPWATFCPHSAPPPSSGSGTVVVQPGSPDPSLDDPEAPSTTSADVVQVTVDSTNAFSCSGDSSSDDSGCSSSSSGDGHDGCSCDGSSGSSEGSGCGSSGSEPSGGGCSGGGAGSSDCTVGPTGAPRRKPRVAKIGFLVALGALVARRWRRPPRAT